MKIKYLNCIGKKINNLAKKNYAIFFLYDIAISESNKGIFKPN